MSIALHKIAASHSTAESLLFLTKKERRHLESLLSVTMTIESIFHLDALLEKIMDHAIQVTGSERGFLFLYSEQSGDLELKVARGVPEEIRKDIVSHETYKLSSEIIDEVAKTGKALIGGQAERAAKREFSELKDYGIEHVLCVPLRTRDKSLGVLYLDCCSGGEIYGEEELELMQSFAVLLSVSIENAYLMSRQDKEEHGNITVTIESTPPVPHLRIISIKGFMDSVATKDVDEVVLPIIEFENVDVILDLSTMDYISRMGMLCLMNYVMLMSDKKRIIKFVRPPQHVYNAMKVYGLNKKIDTYDSIEAAINSSR